MIAFDIVPEFHRAAQGQIFLIHRIPRQADCRQALILIPPFAEEMNQSRRMMALQAQALSERGWLTVIPDFYGTGDSEGAFAEATWQGWVEQLASCISHLKERYNITRYSLLAIRAGALVAADFLKDSLQKPEQVVLWQPVLQGDSYLTQFLRLRLASSMLVQNRDAETVALLKERLKAGATLEVAGYMLAPALALGLQASSLDDLFVGRDELPVHWFDIVSKLDQDMAPGNRKFIETVQSKALTHELCAGKMFWSSVDTVENRQLIDRTTQILCESERNGR